MASWKLETRAVTLDLDWKLGDDNPIWRLPEDRPIWRLPEDRSSGLSLIQSDTPETVFVPDPAPLPLSSIEGEPVARGVGLPWLRWTTINDRTGHFRERFAPGSFTDTLRRDGRTMPPVALVNHGSDPQAGVKPLGKLTLWEASDGLRFELAFLPVDYARDVAAGIRQGLYGASVRFATLSERAKRSPGRSAENPLGLEERTITRAHLTELSMTPLPAYGGTSAVLTA
jgi:HK97 family phage prohead protease